MQDFRLKSVPDVRISLLRSPRAHRISLRVSSFDGRATLVLPEGTPESVGRAFAEEKARWLRDAVSRVADPVPVAIGAYVPVAGRALPVVPGQGRKACLTETAIEAPMGREGPAVEALVKSLAHTSVTAAVDRFATALGKKPKRITLRDTRSRWGSCSSKGNLSFSWRLMLAPPEVLDYIAAHEVAHLRHMDHSAAFWGTVAELFPGYRVHHDWLKRNGASLHRYRFGPGD